MDGFPQKGCLFLIFEPTFNRPRDFVTIVIRQHNSSKKHPFKDIATRHDTLLVALEQASIIVFIALFVKNYPRNGQQSLDTLYIKGLFLFKK
jgi:hypothetical protein